MKFNELYEELMSRDSELDVNKMKNIAKYLGYTSVDDDDEYDDDPRVSDDPRMMTYFIRKDYELDV